MTANALMSRVPSHDRRGQPEHDGDGADGVMGPDGERWNLRMKDLCEATGLMRQAIHFYVKEGLIPPGLKSSRNMAWYGPAHVARLNLIRRLQHERFLPLKAIKAVLDEASNHFGHFGPEQRAFIVDVKRHVDRTLRGEDRVQVLPVDALLERTGVTPDDLAELDRFGLAPVVERQGVRVIAADDAFAVEILGELRALGFTEEAGFGVADLALYEEVVSLLFEREQTLVTQRMVRFKPAQAAHMVERVLPLVHRFIERYHEAKIRRFFAALE